MVVEKRTRFATRDWLAHLALCHAIVGNAERSEALRRIVRKLDSERMMRADSSFVAAIA